MPIATILFLLIALSYAQEEVCKDTPTRLKGIEHLIDCYSPSSKKTIPDQKRNYFIQLLAKGESAPIKDFLELWSDESNEHDSDPYFFACESKPWGSLDIFEKKGKEKVLPSRCKPDVLYSWGKNIKVENIARTLSDDKAWKGNPNPYKAKNGFAQSSLSLAITPAMTFGYGEVLMRFKIKDKAKFISLNDRDPGKGEIQTSPAGYMPEFSLKDASTIESWSYGTPEIYDEIVRDLLRIQSNKRAQHYFGDEKKKGLEKIYIGNSDDAVFDETILKRNLLRLIKQVLNGEGKVFYSKEACRSYEKHYATKKSTWFNPQ